MTRIARKSDGRRIFTTAFKHKQISRVLRGELTLAELSRKLRIAPGLLQRWKKFEVQGPTVSEGSAGGTPTARGLRTTEQYIGDLQRLVGRQTVEVEILRAELVALKQGRRS